MAEYCECRLALILPRSRQLLGIRGPGGFELPIRRIAHRKRLAEQITRQIEREWKINSIVLDILTGRASRRPCIVIEVRTDPWDFEQSGFSVAEYGDIRSTSLAASQLRGLSEILFDRGADREPLTRIGWIEEAERWIERSVLDHQVVFSGTMRQLNAGRGFALIYLGAEKRSGYWLKATASPNLHEFSVTSTLARCLPASVPPLIAQRADWNAWVTEDAGPTLQERPSLVALETAATDLADLQIESRVHIRKLLTAGCIDRSLSRFRGHLDEIIDYLDEAMHRQTSLRAPRLGKQQLGELRDRLNDACFRIEELGIPDTLGHGDLNPGNILFDGTRCVFIDWAEAYIGNPFLSLEYLTAHMAQGSEQIRASIPTIIARYRRAWLDLLSESTIDGALKTVPILAVALYLYGRGEWLRSPRRYEPGFEAFARSLARRMYWPDRSRSTSEALCP